MHPRKALGRRIRKAGVAARAGLFVVLALIALSLAAPSAAYADFACNFTGDESYHMDSPGSNGEGIMPAVAQWQEGGGSENLGDQKGTVKGSFKVEPDQAKHYTLYELNGMRGLNWSMTFKGKGDASEDNGSWGSGADSCQVMAYVNNGIADAVFYGTKVLTRFSISIKEMASNPSPFSGLYTGRDNVVTTLRDNVLKPAVAVMILLVGLWVFTKWRKGDMREVWAGVSWTALTVIAVMAFLTGNNYDKVVQSSDEWIASANSALSSTVLAGVSGRMQSPCDLPDNGKNESGEVGLRLSSCAMYDTLAFRPWAMGQFGDVGANCIFRKDSGGKVSVEDGTCTFNSDTKYDCYWGDESTPRCGDLRVRQAVAQSWSNMDDQRGDDRPDGDKFGEWEDIRKEIAGGEHVPDEKIYPVAFNDWAGKNATDRVGIAFYSLVAAFIVGVMVLVLSALTLLWHAVTLILVMLLPLVATLGIHPSQQKLLKSWFETFVHSFVLRAGFGVILTVLLVLYQMILPAQIALGTQLLMLLLVTIAIVMMLKKLLGGNFTPQVAGGEDMLGIRDAAGKVTAMAPGLAASTAKTSGRVAGGGAKGVASMADRVVTGGKGRGKMQQWGWVGQSKREQRKTQNRAAETTRMKYEQTREEFEARQTPEAETPPAPRRGGRVSGGTGQPAPQPSTPTESRPAPAPSSTPAPAPAAPAPAAAPAAPPKLPQQQAQPPAPRPRSGAAEPYTPPTPPPPPRDPRGPSGRV
ncbi:hypothetical protein ACWC9X_01480 [Streptomyces asoensis]